MTYFICKDSRGKIKLGCYVYRYHSNTFDVQFGTTDRWYRYIDELPFKIIANMSYISEKTLWIEKCPENNILKVSSNDSSISEEVIRKLKGYKKFFSCRNITQIEFTNKHQ